MNPHPQKDDQNKYNGEQAPGFRQSFTQNVEQAPAKNDPSEDRVDSDHSIQTGAANPKAPLVKTAND